MYVVTAGFKTSADDPQQIPTKRFTFVEGVTDFTNKVLNLGTFNLKQYEGDPLTGGSITVELLNDSKEFNFLITDKTNVGKIGKVELGYNAEFIDRFRGTLEEVEFAVEERPKCLMTFSSRVQRAIETEIGSTALAVPYNTIPWNPADMAWDILTVHAGLDSTVSTANVDIDYTSFLSFKSTCASLLFSLRGNFTGQSVAEAMRLIGQVTDSLIYGETAGKIKMVKFVPTEASAPYLFTDANAHLSGARLFFNKDRLRNRVRTFHGYDPVTNIWVGSVTFDNATSQTNFGVKNKTFSNINVWHDTTVSANSFSERFVDRYSAPPETVRFDTKRGTQAVIHQIGDEVLMTWGQVDYTTKLLKIYGINGNLTNDSFQILAEDLSSLNANFFILDSATSGELDTNVLY